MKLESQIEALQTLIKKQIEEYKLDKSLELHAIIEINKEKLAMLQDEYAKQWKYEASKRI